MSDYIRARIVRSRIMHLIEQTQPSINGRWHTKCGELISVLDLRMKKLRGTRNCKRCGHD